MPDFSRTAPMQRWAVPAFFGLVLLLGLLVYRDYGISFDENQQRNTGMVSLKHVAQLVAPDWAAAQVAFDPYGIPLAEYVDRDYGVAFEAPVCLLERLLKIDDYRAIFMFRHLCTFLVCLAGLVAFYQLAARRFQDWRLGLLVALWLLLSPRLFADFFYNDKDAVFLALFVIATNTGVRLLLRPTARRALAHALACALAIDVRIMGVVLPLITLGFLGWRVGQGQLGGRRVLGVAALYLLLLAGLVVALWPYLWPAPLEGFRQAFDKMSRFRWYGTVLYRGALVPATDLPWHYSLVWMGITTPLFYVAAGLLGLAATAVALRRRGWRLWATEEEMQDVLFLGLFAGPLLAVLALHSVLYDGWRQLYFVYPAFLLLALRGWVAAARWRPAATGPGGAGWRARWLPLATALALLVTAAQMVRDHPFQNVYFNLLAGRHVGERFELDYWGLGFRKDLEYIVGHDSRPVIAVYAPPTSAAYFNQLILPADQRARLTFVDDPAKADYVVTNYRWHPEPYPYPQEVYQVRADGRRVHSVFRLR